MPRTKKCVKDPDTGKCRKAKKSGRPRCSGRTPDCVSDASGKYCKKSRKPGRPRVSKRRYKKRSDAGKPRKKRSDAGKSRKKRSDAGKSRKKRSDAGKRRYKKSSDAGKRRYKKSCKPRKKRSDAGKPRGRRSSSKDNSMKSMEDYKNFLKVSADKSLLKNLLDDVGVMMPEKSETPEADKMLDMASTVVKSEEMKADDMSVVNAGDPVELELVEKFEPIYYEPKFKEWGTYLTSDGTREWIGEIDLIKAYPNKKEELEKAKAAMNAEFGI